MFGGDAVVLFRKDVELRSGEGKVVVVQADEGRFEAKGQAAAIRRKVGCTRNRMVNLWIEHENVARPQCNSDPMRREGEVAEHFVFGNPGGRNNTAN